MCNILIVYPVVCANVESQLFDVEAKLLQYDYYLH